MNPSIPRRPAEDPARRQEAEKLVSTARDILSGWGKITEGKIKRSFNLLIKALHLNPCAPGGHGLLVAVVALRTTTNYRYQLPSGLPDPYRVFGFDPAVPTARDPAVVESYYRQASDLLDRYSHPAHPCHHVFSVAARLVADAWAVLSDAGRKASLDSRFEELPPAPPPPPPPAPQPSAPPTPPQAGQEKMGRGKGRWAAASVAAQWAAASVQCLLPAHHLLLRLLKVMWPMGVGLVCASASATFVWLAMPQFSYSLPRANSAACTGWAG